MNEKIGIIVPVYNVEKYIRQCIDSVISQTYDNWSLILVDDGSPDAAPRICEEYKAKDSRIKVIHKKNGGLVSAWIAGIESLSDYEHYIVFLDSDDWLSPCYLQGLVEAQIKTGAEIVVTQLRNVFPDGALSQKPYHIDVKLYDRNQIEDELYPKLINAGDFQKRAISTSRCGKLIKTDLIKNNIKYLDDAVTYEEDFNIMVPVFLDCQSIYIIKDEKCLYMNRANPLSMTHSYDSRMMQSIEYVYKSIKRVLDDRNLFEYFKTQYLSEYLAAGVQYYKNELLNPQGMKQSQENIGKFCTKNDLLDEAIEEVEWSRFRMLNKLIIKTMIKPYSIVSLITFMILREFKNQRYKNLLKMEN